MKGLILAGVSIGWLVSVCAVSLRVYRGDKEYKVFLGSLGSALGLYCFLFSTLPRDLAFLPQRLVEPASVVDFWNGILVLLMMFHGFWVFAYVMCLGPTITILAEMGRRREYGMTKDEVLRIFGGDGPANVILRRRLPKLIKGGYVAEEGGVYRLLPRGRVPGRICIYARRALGM